MYNNALLLLILLAISV